MCVEPLAPNTPEENKRTDPKTLATNPQQPCFDPKRQTGSHPVGLSNWKCKFCVVEPEGLGAPRPLKINVSGRPAGEQTRTHNDTTAVP